MWSLTLPRAGRASGAEKFRSSARKDFFNSIDPTQTSNLIALWADVSHTAPATYRPGPFRPATVDKHAKRGVHLSGLNSRRNGPPRPIVFTSRCCEANGRVSHEEVHVR